MGRTPSSEHKRETKSKGQKEINGLNEVEGQSSWAYVIREREELQMVVSGCMPEMEILNAMHFGEMNRSRVCCGRQWLKCRSLNEKAKEE